VVIGALSFMRSWLKWFEKCTARSSNKKPAAYAAGFVFSGAEGTCSPKWTERQNCSDEIGTGLFG
jgi:hypothetical protein